MKIKYLGTAASEGIPAIFCECANCKRSRMLGGKNIRTRSQAIIDDVLLIDFPADTYMHYLIHHMPMGRIKTCIITHSHTDHLYYEEIEMRQNGVFAHLSSKNPLTFYACDDGYNKLSSYIKYCNIGEGDVRTVRIEPYKAFEADGYKIMPIKAEHDPDSSPVVFVIEKDGKSIFYANDSSEYSTESIECLKSLKKPIDVVSFDCTEACNHTTYVGHLSLERCIALRKKLIDENIAYIDTVFVLNHFSHNGANVVYDDFVKIAAEHSFLVSYDGMELEF